MVASLYSTTQAHACIESIAHDVEIKPVDLTNAVKALDEGRLDEAAKRVATAFPKLRATRATTSGPLHKAQRVMALAILRSDGSPPKAREFSATTDAERTANIAWADDVLRAHASQLRDPASTAALAEVQMRDVAGRGLAKEALEDLASRDVMPNAAAWAALAKLRASASDSAGAQAATARCEAQKPQKAKGKTILDCAPPPPASSG